MSGTLVRVLAGTAPVIAGLVAAAFLAPPEQPLVGQLVLFSWGLGGILLAERLLFGPGWGRAAAALGFVTPRTRALVVALIVSLPMWLFLPVYGWFAGIPIGLNPNWLAILLGVILVNGIAEEAIHRAFIFGHLRRERLFAAAATISAAIFAVQHIYLMFTIGAVAGFASILLALFLAFPLAFLYERGGSSIGAPAILHTSSNAPMMLFVTSDVAGIVVLPHMSVVLVSIYLSFAFARWLRGPAFAASV
jgi:membrane protease YdiL (CAAX protease family)